MDSPAVSASAAVGRGVVPHNPAVPPPPPPQPHRTRAASPAPAKSPSPPASTCRRLSYESAQTRSRTRASASRSSSAPPSTPLHPQQQQQQRVLSMANQTNHHVHSPPKATAKKAMPASSPPKAPTSSTTISPGSPAAVSINNHSNAPTAAGAGAGTAHAGLKRSSASTPEFVQYSSEQTSPSPAATATSFTGAVPRDTAASTGAACGAAVAAADVNLRAVPSRASLERPVEVTAHSVSQPQRDVSAFSCVLTNQTRTSGTTEPEKSGSSGSTNAVTSEEKSTFLNASPPSAQKLHGVVDVTEAVPRASPYQQPSLQQEKPKVSVAALYAPAVPSDSACTPPGVLLQQKQQQQQQQRMHGPPQRSVSSPVSHRQTTAAALRSPSHGASPLQARRSHSTGSGGARLHSRGMQQQQQPPSLRSGLAGGPSPYAAEQLAMPRRPSPVGRGETRSDAMSGSASTAAPHSQQQPQQRPLPPPQVQLAAARPTGLYRHTGPSSTSMAASQLPGAAAAHNRLVQLPQRSRLVRTASSSTKTGDDANAVRRRTPSASSTTPLQRTTTAGTPSSPFKRRSSSASSGVRKHPTTTTTSTTTTTKAAATAASTTAASGAAPLQPHQRTPSGTFALYTTRGGVAATPTKTATTGSAAAAAAPNGGDANTSVLSSNSSKAKTSFAEAGRRAPRSNSAPALRRAGVTPAEADMDTVVPAAIRSSSNASRRLHTAGGNGHGISNTTASPAAYTSPFKPMASAVGGDAAQPCPARTRSTTRTVPAATTRVGRAESGSPKLSRAPSSSTTTTAGGAASTIAATSREVTRVGPHSSRPVAASGLTRRAVNASATSATTSATTVSAVQGSGVRPTISAGSAGVPGGPAHTQRARPVVSTLSSKTSAGAASPTRPSQGGGVTRRVRPSTTTATTSRSGLTRRTANTNSTKNTISAAQSSMITMEESREFLQEFQKMNQRELALFGTLLATVATERQQKEDLQQQKQQDPPQQQQQHDGATLMSKASTTQPVVAGATDFAVQSAEEVSVWTCKRPSVERPGHPRDLDAESAATLGEREASLTEDKKGEEKESTAATPIGKTNVTEVEAADNTEVVILVRRSCSRVSPSKTPSPTRRLDLDSHEKVLPQRGATQEEEEGKQHQQQQQQERSPSPRPSIPQQQQPHAAMHAIAFTDENTHPAGGMKSGIVEVAHQPSLSLEASPSPSSPAPASPPLVGAADTKIAPLTSAAYPVVKDQPSQPSGRVSTKLQQRNANDANVKSSAAAPAGGLLNRKHPQHQQESQRPSASLHSSRSRRRRRVAADGAGGLAAPSELPAKNTADLPHQPQQRQRSVMSYTDMRSYSRHGEEETGEDGVYGRYNAAAASARHGEVYEVREYSPEGPTSLSAGEVGDGGGKAGPTPPPLAALRRAKELAAEQAAALVQRQRERQQQQQWMKTGGELDGDGASRSHASPSMFSSCGSPSGSSMGRPSSSALNGGAAMSGDVAEVRMSAAQLQLLIDGSRSRQNWERYQQI